MIISQLELGPLVNAAVYKCILFVLTCQWTPKNDWKHFMPSSLSLNVLRFDLYLLKLSIFRALKRDLERAYLMIVGQSLHFTSCYWRCNLCTAIFHRRVWSMNSKEWLPKFYAFKFCSPTVFNFDFHKIEKGILRALQRDLSTRCVWSMFASRAFSYIPISTCQITIEIYKREERKPSGNKLGSLGEKKNQTILFWNARPTEYDAESAWKKWTRFLTEFTANANGKFRLLFFLSNRPNREIHKYLLITINADICVAYTNCKPHYVMIEDIYSWLSRWTERLSRGLPSSKIGSSLCSAKLSEIQSSRKRPLMVAVTRCRRSVFYLVFGSSFRFHTPAFL